MNNNQPTIHPSSKADHIACLAYDMTTGKPFDSLKDESFPMYSFSRVAHLFWAGFADKCLESGLTESQTKELMQSKLMRRGLDQAEDDVSKAGYDFVEPCMIEWAKEQPS